MTLGARILQYRTARGWSQEDLAAALEVSRQSVSKWETDASTPDLDKIVRLSEIFAVTLDELVTGQRPGGASPEPPPPVPAPPEAPSGMSAGQIVKSVLGVLLLCLGFGLDVVLLFVTGSFMALLLTAPLLLCGVICLTARRRTGLWCGWALFLWLDCYLRMAVGVTWKIVRLNPDLRTEHGLGLSSGVGWFLLLWIAVLLFLTAVSYRELRLPLSRENIVKYAGLVLAVFVVCPLAMRFAPPVTVLYGLNLTDYLLSALQLLLAARVIVLGAAMLRQAIEQRGA